MADWLSNISGDWTNPTSWNGFLVPNSAGAVANFPAFGGSVANVTVSLQGSSITIGSLTIANQSTKSIFIQSNSSGTPRALLNMSSAGNALIEVGTSGGPFNRHTIAYDVDLNLISNTTISIPQVAATLNLSAKITGAGTLTKTGSGTLLIGNNLNDWTGGMVVQNGTVQLINGGLALVGAIQLDAAGVLDLDGFNQSISRLSGTGAVLFDGAQLSVTAQNANISNEFNGSASADRLFVVLDPSLANFSLSGAFFLSWTAADTVTVYGNNLANDINGSNVAETIIGSNGNDTIYGRGGNDTLDGGSGTDRATYTAERVEYSVFTYNSGGTLYTNVTAATATDGADRLTGFEVLDFDGILFKHAGAQQNKMGNVAASRFDDVIFHSDTTGQSYGYIMSRSLGIDGTGVVVSNGALSTTFGGIWDAIDSGDMNGDGRADIIYRNSSDGSLAFGLMGSSGVGSTPTLTNSLSTSYRFVGVQDMDGDAWLDVVIQNTANGIVYVGDLTGTTFNGWTAVSNEGTLWRTIGMGDVNGDGRADYIYQHQGTGFITAGLANATGGIASYQALTGSQTLNWFAKEVADVNADGYADVLIQNGSNGDISYVNMANGVPTSYGTVMNGFGTAWQLEGMADTNNDGDLDAVIRNVTGSGDTYVVNMEAGAFQSFTLVAQGIGSQWYVV